MQVGSPIDTVLILLQFAVFASAAYAFVHAAMQRADAYIATEKLTKPVWLIILGVSGLLALAALLSSPFDVLFPAIAACAAGVYLADVKPRLLEVQGKSH